MMTTIVQSYLLINDMIMDAPIVVNGTIARMLGKMLLISNLLPFLCTGNHEFDVACRYSHVIDMHVKDAMNEYKNQVLSNMTLWGTAFG